MAPTGSRPTLEELRAAKRQRAQLHRGIHNLALGALFVAALLAVIIACWRTPDRAFSDAENRRLAQTPAFSLSALADGSYFSGLSDYVSDQFVGRDWWISLKLKMERLIGRKESNGVYLCQDHYLIETPEANDGLAMWRSIDAMNRFAATHPSLNTQVLIAPNAITILDDLLPENAPKPDQKATLGLIRSSLLSSIGFIDVTDALAAHAQEGVFYRTDHHWTSLGARYAFEAAAPGLGIVPLTSGYDVHVVSDSFEGTLASKSGCHEVTDTVEVYTPLGTDVIYYVNYKDTQTKSRSLYVSSALEGKDHYTVFFGGNHPLLEVRTTANNGRNLLIFKDSYANCFVQFLTPYYDSIWLVDPRYYYDDVESVIQTANITDVLYLYNLNTFLSDTALTDALGG